MLKYFKNLCPLVKSQKIGQTSNKNSFDWHQVSDVLAKVDEELVELKHEIIAKNKNNIKLELGDLLFSIAQLSRHLDINSSEALHLANYKFEKRFSAMMSLCKSKNLIWKELSDSQKHKLWEEVKKLNPTS